MSKAGYTEDELVRVVDVYGVIRTEAFFYSTRIVCVMEDGRYFYLERVPFDIIIALKKLRGEEIEDDRERLVDILVSMPEVVELMGKHLKRVIINELNMDTAVYSAIAEFSDGNMVIRRKMVPSHAIFLAVLTSKPIYVRRQLIDEQEEMAMNDLLDEGSEADLDDDEEFDDIY